MSATKEQERKALEEIRKIVDSLGKDSYIATAFEGCFEDAEENIDNDFALSWKNRAEVAGKRVDELEKKYTKLVDNYEEMKHDIATLESMVLDTEDMVFLKNIASDWAADEEHLADEAADKIVALALNPHCDDFRNAVTTHRARSARAKKGYEVAKRLEERITGKH
ncbi:MAG: hypothetical protein II897_04185 [Clostridia bacterium]|nr:hypothetical protein [Clostridia bacterium]